jgi:hypothetical protein
MFEVVVTYRPDFREHPLGQYRTLDEARQAAQQFAVEHYLTVVRTRVREIQKAKANG